MKMNGIILRLLLVEFTVPLFSAYSPYDFGIFENQPLLESLVNEDIKFMMDLKNLIKESNESKIAGFIDEESITIEV